VRDALLAHGAGIAVTDLHRLVERIRGHEQQEPLAPADRDAWRGVRALAHRLLAERQSRLALYDLKEMLDQEEWAVSPDLIEAAAGIADAEAIPSLYARWRGTGESAGPGAKASLERAVRTVIEREGLTRTHPVLVQLLTRHPDAAPLVALAPRRRAPDTKRRRP
jgi:hypothetical protein